MALTIAALGSWLLRDRVRCCDQPRHEQSGARPLRHARDRLLLIRTLRAWVGCRSARPAGSARCTSSLQFAPRLPRSSASQSRSTVHRAGTVYDVVPEKFTLTCSGRLASTAAG